MNAVWRLFDTGGVLHAESAGESSRGKFVIVQKLLAGQRKTFMSDIDMTGRQLASPGIDVTSAYFTVHSNLNACELLFDAGNLCNDVMTTSFRQIKPIIPREITMKSTKNLITVLFAFVLFALAGCVSTPTTEGTGAYVEDSVITTKVKAVILNEPMLKSREINVETFKGVVQLSGFVTSEAEAQKAVEVTRGIKGVMSVKNDMRLK